MSTRSTRIGFVLALLAASGVALLAVSGVSHAAEPHISQNIQLDRTVVVGGASLPAGTYALEIAPDGMARFTQKRKTVAEAPCKVALADVIYPGTAVHTRTQSDGRDRLVKVVFPTSKIAIEFPDEVAVAGAGASPSPAPQVR